MAANQTANFVVKAKDQATGPLGKIGTSMGKLRRTGVTAFKGIATASVAAATALAGFAAAAVKSAADDERQTILLNAALKQRGLFTEDLNAKIQQQILSMGALGIADDQVRAGLEVGSRFFADQATLLQANAIAADIAAVTGQDLAEVMTTLGKGAQGTTRGLKALGITVEKGATIQDILTAATAKYGGTAAEIANSTSGKFARAQVGFNEAMEDLGYKLLPRVNEFMDFLTRQALPAFEKVIALVAPVLDDLITNYIAPVAESFGDLFEVFGGAEGSVNILLIALEPLKIFLQALKITIDAIVAGLKMLFAAQGALGTAGMTSAGYSPYLANAVGAGTFAGAAPGLTTTNNIFIGTGKVDTVVTDSINRTGTFKRGR
jgi:hypothetical protein